MKLKFQDQDESVLTVERVAIQSVTELYMVLHAAQLYVASHPDVWFAATTSEAIAERDTVELSLDERREQIESAVISYQGY